MPPLRPIRDRGIDGKMLLALDESGHGRIIAIVDASYNIPRSAQVVDYHGASSAQALRGVLQLVYAEDEAIVFMLPDEGDERSDAALAFGEVASELRLKASGIQRQSRLQVIPDGAPAFYNAVNDPEKDALFIRTRDPLAYACCYFVVADSQDR